MLMRVGATVLYNDDTAHAGWGAAVFCHGDVLMWMRQDTLGRTEIGEFLGGERELNIKVPAWLGGLV